jgi:CHAT domain-containing protein
LRGTDLVVLSACETGRGKVENGEGVFGLRRAFLFAGARTLITSLVSVPDVETREFMTRFYQSLSGGATKLEALHTTQLQMKRKYQHPFFWASFVLIGSPD